MDDTNSGSLSKLWCERLKLSISSDFAIILSMCTPLTEVNFANLLVFFSCLFCVDYTAFSAVCVYKLDFLNVV